MSDNGWIGKTTDRKERVFNSRAFFGVATLGAVKPSYSVALWRNDTAILALSNRGKRADIFWFTFFHELAHVLHHQGKSFHISCSEEDEADDGERNYLISAEDYKTFIEHYEYTVKSQIVAYSEKIGIAPSILVGRLQHDGYLEPHYCNDLRPLFEIKPV